MNSRVKKGLAVAVILLALFVIRTRLPFYELISGLPYHNLYAAVFKSSGICGKWGDYAGLFEAIRTKNARLWAAQNSRRGEPDASGMVQWETPYGGFWFPAATEPINVFFTIAQYKVVAYPGVSIHPGDTVIDAGGFVGDWAKWVLQAGASHVIVVEPGVEQQECIRRNLAAEIREGRVVLYPKGLWDRDERLLLGHDSSNPAGDSVGARGDGEYIDLTTLDKMVAELGVTKIDVLKMDIEGAESRAIRGARETLNRFHPQLAIATEHTDDHLKNNHDVIQAVHETAPFYKNRCGYCELTGSGPVPETLYFVQ